VTESILRRSALEAIYKECTVGNGHGLSLHERHPLNMFDIGGEASDEQFLTAAKSALGCALPVIPNTVSHNGTKRVLWLSPSRWLCVDGATNAELKPFDGAHINNVSSGRTVIRLQGPQVRDVLASGCPHDLHQRNFPANHCAQSKMGSLNVLIDHLGEETFDLYVARGFARVLWEELTEASTEYGYRVIGRRKTPTQHKVD
jgi:sarcosine oxidase, subunit gamma